MDVLVFQNMDLHYVFAVLAVVLSIVSVVPYVYDMLCGTTRPNVVSWGLWFLIQGIFAAAQFDSGASLSVVLPIAEVATVGLIVFLGLSGYGYKKYGVLDGVCFSVALVAIVLWQITNDPIFALWLAVLADFIAVIPTLYKSYRDPESETPLAYFFVVLAAVSALFATSLYDVPNLLWPIYIIVVNASVIGLVLLGRRAQRKTS